jgi:hypothetical protein
MFRHCLRPVCWAGMCLVIAAVAAGCGCKGDGPPQRQNVTVSLDPKLAKQNIQVHVVAVNATQLPEWKNAVLNRYWSGEDPLRESYPSHRMVFDRDLPTQQTFNPKTPDYKRLWAEWGKRKATSLVVVANLILDEHAPQGPEDRRRKVVPLGKCRWHHIDRKKGIMFLLTEAGVELQTPPAPRK